MLIICLTYLPLLGIVGHGIHMSKWIHYNKVSRCVHVIQDKRFELYSNMRRCWINTCVCIDEYLNILRIYVFVIVFSKKVGTRLNEVKAVVFFPTEVEHQLLYHFINIIMI